MGQALLHVRTEAVEDDLRSHTRYRGFSCRIDVEQNHLIEQGEGVSKFVIEIAGAGVEVGLENGGDFATIEHFTEREDALSDFGRVVCIVAEEDTFVRLDFEIEAAVHSTKRGHGAADAVGIDPGNLCQSTSRNAVVDVDAHGDAQFDVAHIFDG